MSNAFQSVFDAYKDRIRSPFWGTLIFAFLVLHWRELFLLAFSEKNAEARISAFDPSFRDWGLTILVGLAFFLATPWIKYFGAWIASYPSELLRKLEEHKAHERALRKLKYEDAQAREKEAYEQARRDAALKVAKDIEKAKQDYGIEAAERVRSANLAHEARQDAIFDVLKKWKLTQAEGNLLLHLQDARRGQSPFELAQNARLIRVMILDFPELIEADQAKISAKIEELLKGLAERDMIIVIESEDPDLFLISGKGQAAAQEAQKTLSQKVSA